MTNAQDTVEKLKVLHRHLRLDLNVNDLRILVGCLRAMSYQMKIDDEPYLDADGLELQQRLESRYRGILDGAAHLFAS